MFFFWDLSRWDLSRREESGRERGKWRVTRARAVLKGLGKVFFSLWLSGFLDHIALGNVSSLSALYFISFCFSYFCFLFFITLFAALFLSKSRNVVWFFFN